MININIKSEVQSEAFKTSVWLFVGQMFGEGRQGIRNLQKKFACLLTWVSLKDETLFFVLFEAVMLHLVACQCEPRLPDKTQKGFAVIL